MPFGAIDLDNPVGIRCSLLARSDVEIRFTPCPVLGRILTGEAHLMRAIAASVAAIPLLFVLLLRHDALGLGGGGGGSFLVCLIPKRTS